jgi:hypothetical protein
MKSIEKRLVGKTIKSAVLTADENAPSVVLEFTDGTTFSLLSEAKPNVEVAFFLSAKDGDELRKKLA